MQTPLQLSKRLARRVRQQPADRTKRYRVVLLGRSNETTAPFSFISLESTVGFKLECGRVGRTIGSSFQLDLIDD